MRALIAVVASIPALALGQVPAKIGYQGRLLKADGTPEGGVVKMTFSVYSAGTGGTALWTEDQSVAMTDGFYSVFLGDVKPFAGGVFDGADKYLEVSANGLPLSPRQRVGSVPYALVAHHVAGGKVDAASLSVSGKPVIDNNGKLVGTAAYTAAPGSGLVISPKNALSLVDICKKDELLKYDGTSWVCALDLNSPTLYSAGEGIAIDSASRTISLPATCASKQILKWSGSKWECKADDDENTTYAAGKGISIGAGNAISLSSSGCTSGQILQWTGSDWVCAADKDSLTKVLPGAGIKVDVSGLDHTVSLAPCAGGQILRFNSAVAPGKWECSSETTTAYKNGPGIRIDPSTNAIGLVTSCTAGQVLKAGASGDWACASDANSGGTVTDVTAGVPLASSRGPTPHITLSKSSATTDGYLSLADWGTFNDKAPGAGSTSYIQNGAGAQNASFNVTGNGTIGGSLTVGGKTVFDANGILNQAAGDKYAELRVITNTTGTPDKDIHLNYPVRASTKTFIYNDTELTGNLAVKNGGLTVGGKAIVSATGVLDLANAMSPASASANGYLKSADWTTFNDKAPGSGSTSYIQNGAGAQNASFNVTGNGTIGGSLTVGGKTVFDANGILNQAAGDKYAELRVITNTTGTPDKDIHLNYPVRASTKTFIYNDTELTGNLAVKNGGLTVGGKAIVSATGVLDLANAMSPASASANGYLKSADWTTFNDKAPGSGSPNYIQNGTTQQAASFNVSGSGTVAGSLTVGGAAVFNSSGILNQAAGDKYAELRVITNTTGTPDKDIYLNYPARGNSKTHIYNDTELTGNFKATGMIASRNNYVQRDILTFSTGAGGGTPIHVKTQLVLGTGAQNIMYRLVVEGYNYGNGQSIFSECVGYATPPSNGDWASKSCRDYAPGVVLSQYRSTDGFVVLKLTAASFYYAGFSLSGWFVNPTGAGFTGSYSAVQQASDL
jgi:hypothetical protein